MAVTPGADTWIEVEFPDDAHGGTEALLVAEDGGDDAHILLQLARDSMVTAIASRDVLSVHLELTMVTLPGTSCGGGDGLDIHRVLRPWEEATATWGCADENAPGDFLVNCDVAWSAPGGDYESTPITNGSSICAGASPPYVITFDITTEVMRILDDPMAPNHGWLVRANRPFFGKVFSSREADVSVRPRVRFFLEDATTRFAPREPTPPPLDRTRPTHVYDAMAWLLEPDRTLQWDFATGVFEPDRANVLRGRVFDRDTTQPIEAVEVSVVGHSELGVTRTRLSADGTTPTGNWELLVNGGGRLRVRYEHPDYLPAERAIEAEWNSWTLVPDVALIPRNAECASINAGSPHMLVTRTEDPGSLGRGARSMRLFVPSGTTVTYDGQATPVDAYRVCLQEATVDPPASAPFDAEAVMPAELPPGSTYTFATAADVEVPAPAGGFVGVDHPTFSNDVYLYLRSDGFLDFPRGTSVPVGTLDAALGAWRSSPDGVVLEVLNDDPTGCLWDGAVDPDTMLPIAFALSSSDEEDAVCGDDINFALGSRFWRVPVRHFSFIDLNFLAALLASLPEGTFTFGSGSAESSVTCGGSIIHCENGALGERFDLAGTGVDLVYLSDHQVGTAPNTLPRGRTDAFTVRVTPIAGTAPSPLPQAVLLDLVVANRRRPPLRLTGTAMTSPQVLFWDGLDAYGREFFAPERGYLRIGYEYAVVYRTPPAGRESFGVPTDATAELLPGGRTIIVWVTRPVTLGVVNDAGLGLGGLGIDAHHVYDPDTSTIFFGDGTRRFAESVSLVSNLPDWGQSAPGAGAITAGPDGSVYWYHGDPGATDATRGTIRVRRPESPVATSLGTTRFNAVVGMSFGTYLDASGAVRDAVYVLDGNAVPQLAPASACTLTRLDAETGAATLVLGQGSSCDDNLVNLDLLAAAPYRGTPEDFKFGLPHDVAAGPEGWVYLALGNRVVRVREDGAARVVELVVGNDATVDAIRSIAVAPDGGLFYAIAPGGPRPSHTIMRRGGDGRLLRWVGGGSPVADAGEGAPRDCITTTAADCARLDAVLGLSVGPGEQLCWAEDRAEPAHGARIRCLTEQRAYTVAGLRAGVSISEPPFDENSSGAPATSTAFGLLGRFVHGPDRRFFAIDSGPNRVRLIEPPFDHSLGNPHLIASGDGSLLYEFTGAGRHLFTRDALTRTPLLRFQYDDVAQGRLVRIDDVEGAGTLINHGAGTVTITAPGSLVTRVRLDAAGRVDAVEQPEASTWNLDVDSGGLLNFLVDPDAGHHDFTWDRLGSAATGRLLTDADAADDGATLPGPTQMLSLREPAAGRWLDVHLDAPASELSAAARRVTFGRRTAHGGLERRVSHVAPIPLAVLSVPADGEGAEATYFDGVAFTLVRSFDRPDPRFGEEAAYPARTSLRRPVARGLSGEDRTWLGQHRSRDFDTGVLTYRTVPPTPGTATSYPDEEFAAAFVTRLTPVALGPSIEAWDVTADVPSERANRRVTARIDSQGRIERIEPPGEYPICLTYATGSSRRITGIRRAALDASGHCDPTDDRRFVQHEYEAPTRFLAAVTGAPATPRALRTTFVRDDRGWIDTVSLPGRSEILNVDLDARGNLVSHAFGARTNHVLRWTPRDSLDGYDRPTPAPGDGLREPVITDASYRDDGRLASRSFADGTTLTVGYRVSDGYPSGVTLTGDPSGLPSNLTFASDALGRPTSVVAPSGTLGVTWDGPTLAAQSWTSADGIVGVTGRVETNVDLRLLLAGEDVCVGSADPTCTALALSYHYDQDRVLDGAGLAGRRLMFYSDEIDEVTGVRVHHANALNARPGGGVLDPVMNEADAMGLVTETRMNLYGDLELSETRRSKGLLSLVFSERICFRDELGRVVRREESYRRNTGSGTDTVSYHYTYDARGMLSRYERFSGGCAGQSTATRNLDESYVYDDAGNRDILQVNEAGEARFRPGTGTVLDYDDRGRVIRDGSPHGTDALLFTWDGLDRLRLVEDTRTAARTEYDFDGAGRLVAIRPTAGAATVHQRFLYGVRPGPIAWQRASRDATCAAGGMDTAYFVYGTASVYVPDMMYVSVCGRAIGADDVYRIVRDERGSVRAVARVNNGQIVERISYSAWGAATYDVTAPGGAMQPFGFAGGILDAAAGLRMRMGARVYDPALGRWMSMDPILFAGGTNLYVYCQNDPINHTDPSGLNGPLGVLPLLGPSGGAPGGPSLGLFGAGVALSAIAGGAGGAMGANWAGGTSAAAADATSLGFYYGGLAGVLFLGALALGGMLTFGAVVAVVVSVFVLSAGVGYILGYDSMHPPRACPIGGLSESP